MTKQEWLKKNNLVEEIKDSACYNCKYFVWCPTALNAEYLPTICNEKKIKDK